MPWEEQGMEFGFVIELACSLQPTFQGIRILASEASNHEDACPYVIFRVSQYFLVILDSPMEFY